MGLSIKNEEVEARVRRLAELTGQGVTEAIDTAVREKLEREEESIARRVTAKLAAWEAFVAEHGPFPKLDQKAIDDEMYDELGLPR